MIIQERKVKGLPVIHKLKTWPEFYQLVVDGKKPFELRPADRDFREGDYLCLQEFRKSGFYTGRKEHFLITYVFKGKWGGLAEGWVILGIKKVSVPPVGLPVLKPTKQEPGPSAEKVANAIQEELRQMAIRGMGGEKEDAV